jgi:nucleoside phosphorylase
MTSAAIHAMKMVYEFRPRYLAMSGVTAGLRESCNMGDILVADPAWDYGSGKWISRGTETIFEIAPHQISLQPSMRAGLNVMSGRQEILDKIRNDWRAPKPQTALRMILGPLASGSAVRADSKAALDVKAQHRKTVGIEMEAYGVMAAAHDAPLPEVSAFVMKSVCDFADETKSNEHQAYAAYTSAVALQNFAEQFLTL